MKIQVAGAGAGKTSGLAETILEAHKTISDEKNIYCIAFTNSAVETIRGKLINKCQELPRNIIVSTIHSFLYNELISPYYFLLYGIHYKALSMIKLDENPAYKKIKLNKLEAENILHVTSIPERAKWLIYKKSSDTSREKELRKVIAASFSKYCGAIFIDEAQDIDKDMLQIIQALDSLECDVFLYGDPKQDIKGYGCFRELMDSHQDNLQYVSKCYRCPEIILGISNSFINEKEKQTSGIEGGEVSVCFESTVDIEKLIAKDFDLKYIYRKNDRISTHAPANQDLRLNTICHEISIILKQNDAFIDKKLIDVLSYNYAVGMCDMFDGTNEKIVMKKLSSHLGEIEKKSYASIISALCVKTDSCDLPVVSSIESIKGLEGHDCLFILTNDLAAYLFKQKSDENKIKNALYVALTRSLEKITILITKEVETKYSKEYILDYIMGLVPKCINEYQI